MRLQPGDRLNRDFILRFRLGSRDAEKPIDSSLSLHPDPDGRAGTFALTLIPPSQAESILRPRDVAFVLDRSGSMEGWKIVAARRAMARMIDTLGERDRFIVLAFDNGVRDPARPGLHPGACHRSESVPSPGIPGQDRRPRRDRDGRAAPAGGRSPERPGVGTGTRSSCS